MKKYALGFAVATVIIFVGVIFSQLQIAFGWTNPTQNPPGGSGLLTALGTNLGVNATNPSTTLTVGGEISVSNNKIRNLTAPTNSDDAVNLGYLNNVLAAGGPGSGGGSLVVYGKSVGGAVVGGDLTCPSGWNPVMTGYGPHFLGVFAYDWYQNGTGGTGGGFASGGSTPAPPPSPPGFGSSVPPGGMPSGATFVTNAVGFGSDSVCSRSQTTVIPLSQLYKNGFVGSTHTVYANACNAAGPSQECNICLICEK